MWLSVETVGAAKGAQAGVTVANCAATTSHLWLEGTMLT